jgi:hypothetical protein
MPDAPLCAACHADAVRRRGRCAGCGDDRLLPGIDGAGCRLCLPVLASTRTTRAGVCGTEWALVRGSSEWCHLGDVLDDLLVGDVDLGPLRARLLEAARPDRIIICSTAFTLASSFGASPPPRCLSRTKASTGSPTGLRLTTSEDSLSLSGCCPGARRLARFDRWVAEHLAEHAATA